MIPAKKPSLPQPPSPPTGRMVQAGVDGFDVDLREALASTQVRELSFEEFRRAMAQQGKLKHS